ncbi:MAG: type II secretion system F family protein [Candidatus Omnitrophota bacterium]|nr:type II secretion system F family protein [Candidatus Omnitrophota bacterium]
MSTFTYTARDQQGLAQKGHLDAPSAEEVAAILQHRGLLVTSISQKDVASGLSVSPRRASARMHRGVTTEDQMLLCQQLSTMVEAGVPLLKSLEVASAQVESRPLLSALDEIRGEIAAGRTFRDALAKHPAIFSGLWLNLVETGEASGHLSQSLNQLARHFQEAQHLRNEVKTALTYPAFLIVAAIGVLAFFVYWLIPKFTLVFDAMGGAAQLPPLTRMVIGVSHAARRYWAAIILGAGAAGYLARRYLRTEPGQWMRDRLALRLPLFKTLFIYVNLAEFTQGLATLLESGVPLLSCLQILEKGATNKLYGQAIGRVKEQVKEGKTMAQPMREMALFPPMVVQMVQVGEEVGELAKMADRLARYYQEHVESFIARMTRLFEPIAIVLMGGMVLVIVLSIFMPIFQMGTMGGGT